MNVILQGPTPAPVPAFAAFGPIVWLAPPPASASVRARRAVVAAILGLTVALFPLMAVGAAWNGYDLDARPLGPAVHTTNR